MVGQGQRRGRQGHGGRLQLGYTGQMGWHWGVCRGPGVRALGSGWALGCGGKLVIGTGGSCVPCFFPPPTPPCFAAHPQSFLPLQGCRQGACLSTGRAACAACAIWGSPARCTRQVTLLGRQHQHKRVPTTCSLNRPPPGTGDGEPPPHTPPPCPPLSHRWRDGDRPQLPETPLSCSPPMAGGGHQQLGQGPSPVLSPPSDVPLWTTCLGGLSCAAVWCWRSQGSATG